VYGGDGLLPRGYLVGVSYSWHVVVFACFGRNEGGFNDEECARDRGTLRVVFYDKGERDMGVVSAKSSHGSHDNTMLKLDIANSKRLIEFG